MNDLAGKRVLVTGGSSGIGLLMASRFVARGASVVIWGTDQGRLDDAVRSMPGGDVAGMVVDVGDRLAVERAAAEVGPIDVLVNNAGIVKGKPLLELAPEDVEATFRTNVLACFWTLRAFLPGMVARDQGHVVTMSSAAGICALPKLADYSASKAAVFALDEALRVELRRAGSRVRTTVVCPFYIATGMFRGVTTRISFLLPILRPGYVADRVVAAVIRGRRRVVLPRVVALIWLLRLLPVRWFDAITAFLGVTASMDEFVGRDATGLTYRTPNHSRSPESSSCTTSSG